MTLRKELRFLRNWITSLLKEIGIYNRTLGFRGILAVSTNLICGYPKEVAVTSQEIKHPLFLRLRTSDARIYEDVILGREYEYVTSAPRTIVDVGANCGITSVFYANQYPEATVVALEPEASNYAALVRNTTPYRNVIPIQAALWYANGQVELFFPWPRFKKWAKWAFRVREGNGCRALTLATLMREAGIDTVDILKIDIEGGECELFSKGDWVDEVKLLAIELHDRDRPGCSATVNAALARLFQKNERGLVTFYSRCNP